MAITILQSPQNIQPVYNPIILALDSDKKTELNFQYIIKVEVDGTEVASLPISSNPDGYGVIDLHKHIEPYVTSSINTSSLATFRKIEDSYVEYSVSLFEEYDVSGTTTQFSAATYTATTYAYNGVVDWLDFRNYDYTDYVMSTASTGNFLTTIPTEGVTMKTTDSSYINFYNQTTNTTNFLEVTTSNGGVYRIANPWQPSVDATKFLQAAVGPFNLANTTSTVTMMSGTYPIIQDSTEYYTVRLLDLSGNPTSNSYRVNIDRVCSKFDTYQMLYMDKDGSYLNFNFDLAHKLNTTVSKKSYNKILGSFSPTTLEWGYSPADRSKKIMDVTINDKYTITSNWVTEADGNRIVDLISSPEVYHLRDSTVSYADTTPIGILTLSNDGGLLQVESAGHGYVVGDLVRFNNVIPAYQNVYAYVTEVTSSSLFTVNYPYSSNSLNGTDEVIKQTVTVTGGDLIAVNIDTNSIEVKQKLNTKMINYTVDFSYTFTNYRQRN